MTIEKSYKDFLPGIMFVLKNINVGHNWKTFRSFDDEILSEYFSLAIPDLFPIVTIAIKQNHFFPEMSYQAS